MVTRVKFCAKCGRPVKTGADYCVDCSARLDAGIKVESDNNTLTNNNCSNNRYGIYLYQSSACTITDNTCENNDNGILLSHTSNSTITNNTISNNTGYGIYINETSFNNIIYHNNLISNSIHAYDDCSNTWDDGYPSGGNYWDNWTSPDGYNGVAQNVA